MSTLELMQLFRKRSILVIPNSRFSELIRGEIRVTNLPADSFIHHRHYNDAEQLSEYSFVSESNPVLGDDCRPEKHYAKFEPVEKKRNKRTKKKK